MDVGRELAASPSSPASDSGAGIHRWNEYPNKKHGKAWRCQWDIFGVYGMDPPFGREYAAAGPGSE